MAIPETVLNRVRSLRPLSATALQLLRITSDTNYKIDDVVRLVETDAVLTANILRVVNSAAFARQEPVSAVSRALPILGEQMLVGIALGLCAFDFFQVSGEEQNAGRALWEHSVFVAVAARELSHYASRPLNPELAYTAGILHDIGKTVLLTPESDAAGDLAGYGIDNVEWEMAQFRTDHAEVGALIASQWALPDLLCSVVRYHHAPFEADEISRPLVSVVHLADLMAQYGTREGQSSGVAYVVSGDYKECLELAVEEIEHVLDRSMSQVRNEIARLEGSDRHVPPASPG